MHRPGVALRSDLFRREQHGTGSYAKLALSECPIIAGNQNQGVSRLSPRLTHTPNSNTQSA
jgi:hypothetical protein